MLEYFEEHTIGLGDDSFVGRLGKAKEGVRVFGGDCEGYVGGEGGEVFHGHGVGGHNERDGLRFEAEMRVGKDDIEARRKGTKNILSWWNDCNVIVRCNSWLTCTDCRMDGFGKFPTSSDFLTT
jgi:hypothetical protein